MTPNYSQALRSLMATANISSFRALAQQAQVSDWQIRQLRHGYATTMRLDALLKISNALEISLSILLDHCSSITASISETSNANSKRFTEETAASKSSVPSVGVNEDNAPEPLQADHALQQEYQRLQHQLEEQRETAQQTFQRTSLQALESWMIYWPAAVHAVQKNPALPASRLISLVKPVEQLLKSWGVEAIASVGVDIPFDPQCHQLIAGTAEAGDRVSVSNPGYRHNDALLHRAKVKAE